MNNEQGLHYITVWKSVAFGLAAPIFINVLHFWLPQSAAWGVGVFLSFVLYYETPPRSRVGSFFMAMVWSAAGGLMAALGAYVSAR